MLTFALAPTQISGTATLLGLLGLGALLFALQRLRVRHRSQLVVTTLFWREALEESRARTLVERFRHPLTYLLLALIGGLLWLSFARLESDRSDGVHHTFLLDGSAGMAVGQRWERAVEALGNELENTPRERTEVLFCGEDVRILLGPGEDRALLGARLEGLAPAAIPSTVESVLVSAAAVRRAELAGESGAARRFVVVGTPLRGQTAESSLNAGDWIENLPVSGSNADAGGNVGITALGVSPARSGAFDAVDALVEIRGAGADGANVTITLGDEAITSAERTVLSADLVQFVCRDLRPKAATGYGVKAEEMRRLVAAVTPAAGKGPGKDSLAFDDRAEILLPELRLVRVTLVATGNESVDLALRAACDADPAIEVTDDTARADVVMGGVPPAGTPPLPRLGIAPAAEQEHSIEVMDGASRDADALLAAAVGELALDRIDAERLASELGRPLSLGVADGLALASGTTLVSGIPRAISLWSELFDPTRSSFTESRAFPVVVGRAARWLVGSPEIVPYAASGRPLPTRLANLSGGPRFPWERAARTVSLLDPDTTTRAAVASGVGPLVDASSRETGGAGPWRFATWILLLALLLLVLEWVLYQRGRIA
ncbi:hypothetical protein Poly30_15390 [Planctomycetes bacterium Poly30]|uniref:Aerotolerance regulator N-terminal domain-containing protein n=1 Tax=Saltatorellus ferox TaxID=2528018 RepID=A0A518EPM4_9BACT|nr:hypothetical protein Poly30_15390 [Planctomycetes bacterium Poly30]